MPGRAQVHQAAADGDRTDPHLQRRASLERADVLDDVRERLLQQVLGHRRSPHQAPDQRVHRGGTTDVDALERRRFALPGCRNGVGVDLDVAESGHLLA
jgi:hypothetical protein